MLKNIIFVILLFAAGIPGISQTSEIQTAPKMNFSIYKDMKDIDIQEYDGNIYISMITGNETENGFYTFERSFDKENFVILSRKTFQENIEEEPHLFTFVNKLPQRPAVYRAYKFTNNEVILICEYEYTPGDVTPVAEKE